MPIFLSSIIVHVYKSIVYLQNTYRKLTNTPRKLLMIREYQPAHLSCMLLLLQHNRL